MNISPEARERAACAAGAEARPPFAATWRGCKMAPSPRGTVAAAGTISNHPGSRLSSLLRMCLALLCHLECNYRHLLRENEKSYFFNIR